MRFARHSQAALAAIPSGDWKIVVGHHAADEIDVEDFTSAIQAAGFDIYLNGHAHTLSQYTIDGTGAYVTSGAGAMVATSDQAHAKVAPKLAGEDILAPPTSSHSYQTVFNDKIAGFTIHTFSDDLTQLTTDYISYAGDTLHSFTVTRGGGVTSDDDTTAADDDDDAATGGCPKTCSGKTCDDWYNYDGNTCATEESKYGCDCSGCECPGDQ